MCLLAGAATAAHAQGNITQDPGRITPGNLTLQRLGPSVDLTGNPDYGAPGVRKGTSVYPGTAGFGSTTGTAPGGSGHLGAGSGAGFGGYSTGGDLSRGIGPGR